MDLAVLGEQFSPRRHGNEGIGEPVRRCGRLKHPGHNGGPDAVGDLRHGRHERPVERLGRRDGTLAKLWGEERGVFREHHEPCAAPRGTLCKGPDGGEIGGLVGARRELRDGNRNFIGWHEPSLRGNSLSRQIAGA